MPVKDRNPFGPDPDESKADSGSKDPFERGPIGVIKCPVCNEARPEKISTQNTPWEILRKCQVCGNQWSGGSVGGRVDEPITDDMKLSPPPSHPDEDVPPDPRMSGTDEWFD